MGLWSRMTRLFSIKANKWVKKGEDPIEVLEYELKNSKEQITKLGDRISDIRADKKVADDDKEKLIAEKERLQRILDAAVDQDDEEMGNEAIALVEKNDAKIEVLESNVKYYEDVINKLEEQHSNLKVKYEDKATKFEALKMKAKFAKNMKTINEEIRKNYSSDDFDFDGIEAIEKEVEKSVYYETDRNDRETENDSLEDRMNKVAAANKFQEYKRKKQEEAGE